jgi:hypothetical protein
MPVAAAHAFLVLYNSPYLLRLALLFILILCIPFQCFNNLLPVKAYPFAGVDVRYLPVTLPTAHRSFNNLEPPAYQTILFSHKFVFVVYNFLLFDHLFFPAGVMSVNHGARLKQAGCAVSELETFGHKREQKGIIGQFWDDLGRNDKK